MFKIYDGREHFYQWDLDRKLIVADRSIAAVHFCNRTSDCALARDCYELEGNWVVDVPNICLQEDYRLKVYGYSEAKYTVLSDCFEIVARTKPEEYAYEEDEINCWQELDERLTRFEENVEEVITEGIEAYFAANPLEAGVGKAVGEGAEIFNDYENNVALGSYSHAEGYESYVSGFAAHAEGYSNATKDYAHAEGYLTEAMGVGSHAEGCSTSAFGDYQHVQGKLNLEDIEKKYAHIVGNGRFPEGDGEWIRSNAHTLDWEGNAWFAGNVRVGGTCWDDATELGAGGECAIEIVNASGEDTIEVDKTYDEIMAMIEAGKVVVIKYNGNLYYQYSDTPAFRYVGANETRYIGFNPRNYSVRYSEYVLPTFEDVGTIVDEAVADFQTAEQVEAIVANYVGVIENGTY